MSVSAYDHDHGYLSSAGATTGSASVPNRPSVPGRPSAIQPTMQPQRTVLVPRMGPGGQPVPMQYIRNGRAMPPQQQASHYGHQSAGQNQVYSNSVGQHSQVIIQNQGGTMHAHQQRVVAGGMGSSQRIVAGGMAQAVTQRGMGQAQLQRGFNGGVPNMTPQRIVLPHGTVYMAPQAHHHYQQQLHTAPMTNSLNLAVPVREATPEPEIKPEPVEQPPSTSQSEAVAEEEDPDIDIQIRNVVCNYTLPLHIDLRRLALNSNNVTFDRGRGVLLKQKRSPNCYVKIYNSGKVYIVGCKSETDCMRAARTVARRIQLAMDKAQDRVCIRNYKVCNVLATCKMPFGVMIEELAQKYPVEASYEPELSVGLVWRSKDPKATLRIHTTGSITVTGAQSEDAVMRMIEIIYPIVREFKCSMRHRGDGKKKKPKKRAAPTSRGLGPSAKRGAAAGASGAVGNRVYFSDEDDIYEEDDLLDDDDE